MIRLYKWLTHIFLFALIIGWVVYPGFYESYYFTDPELYAFPSSLVGPCDPPWGFWFW